MALGKATTSLIGILRFESEFSRFRMTAFEAPRWWVLAQTGLNAYRYSRAGGKTGRCFSRGPEVLAR